MDQARDDLLYAHWGTAGVAVWGKFLQACKLSPTEGRIPYTSEDQLRSELRIAGWQLIDADGKPWTLEEFFTWTGLRKWTRRHRRGWPSIECRHWDELQRRRRIRDGSMQDPYTIPTRSRHSRRSEARNAATDRTGQDSTTTGGAVLSPESNDAPSTRSPQGARSGRSGQDLEHHQDHEVGDWSVCRPLWCDHGACPVECGRCHEQARRTA